MALNLRIKKLDIKAGDPLTVLINSSDAKMDGLEAGDKVWLSGYEHEHICVVNLTDVEVEEGFVGLYSDVWLGNDFASDSRVRLERVSTPESVDYIAKKLQGQRLTEDEMFEVLKDVSKKKMRSVEMAYFMATMFNPGFNDDEVLYAIKGMVNSGEIFDFSDIYNNKNMVVDKHSIGGIAGKGVTPILVAILANFGLVVPNTSTRAITAPAGTTDILETVMPVSFHSEEIYNLIKKQGSCMIWGGDLNIAPADDILIQVEKGLKTQCYQKFIISIIAKKLAMGISHIIIDLPYGPDTKIEEPEDIELVSDSFIKFFDKVGINCEIYKRRVKGPDGRGIGPNLEMRDVLRVLEDHEYKSTELEQEVIKMAGKLLEFTEKEKEGFGEEMAKESMESGKVAEKFWEIAFAQGAVEKVSSDDLRLGKETYDVVATKSGKIERINNKEVVNLARALGTPSIKEAGLYFNKFVGDKVKKGDVLLSFYTINNERMRAARDLYNEEELFKYA